ncbi:MAG TPA: histidinol dehydrogenase [Solirubrobacterales bacterium]|nr:histidinol dehydrogenase [Solirubrobacterales bacterium]
MKARRFDWVGAAETAAQLRAWAAESAPQVEVAPIEREVREEGDAAVLRLTNRLDATDAGLESLRVDPGEAAAALDAIDVDLRRALEAAAANIRTVAAAQIGSERTVELPAGQKVTLREVPVGAAGIYAPGGRAAYPSSVLMCAIPARVAGVGRVALASPPGPDGRVHPFVLAAAALCEVEEIYAMGGAQAIFALAHGTETIAPVDVVAGPGNAWVREAKRAVYGTVGIDSLAGPSELMAIAGHDTDPEWVALDLCAQAEHGPESPVVVAAVEERVLEAIAAEAETAAASRPSVADAPLALVQVPDAEAAVGLANAYAPEHLELLETDAALLAERVTTAGCVFVGRFGATAFGDYLAGSNHVLPTGGAGRYAGPLGPGAFRRRISSVEIDEAAAGRLAPHVDVLARAEGLPVHGESAMIRSRS